MAVRIPAFIATVLILSLAHAPFAQAQSCPPNSTELSRVESKTKITLTCRCADGFWLGSGSCVSRDAALKQSEREIQVIILGLTGEGLPERDSLLQYAIGKNWPPGALNAFLRSVLASARAKFARAKGYLADKLEPLSDDKIVAAFAKLLDAKDRESATQNYLGSLLDRAITESLDKQLNDHLQRETTRSIIQAATAFGEGRYDEAIKLYESVRAGSSVGWMQREMDEQIIWNRALRAQRDEKLNPGQHEAVYRLGRERVAADHAWDLAQAYNTMGLNQKSAELYRQAIAGFQAANPQIIDVLKKQLDVVTSGGKLSDIDTFRTLYRSEYRTQAQVVLDALEYGKGDWMGSVRFLQMAMEIDPTNPKFGQALAKVSELTLSQEQPGRR